MLANFLNKSKPINFIGLLVFFAVCFLVSAAIHFDYANFSINNLLKTLVLLLIFIAVFFIFNFIISKNNLSYDNSYSYYLFTVLCIYFISEITAYKELILTVFYLLFLRKVYSLKSPKKLIKKLFDAGFWVGLLCLFDPKYSLLFLLITLGTYSHQKITIHTFLTPIIGFITPLFSWFSYLFWMDKTADFNAIFLKKANFIISFYTDEKSRLFIIFLLLITVFAIILKSLKTLTINNTFKKNWVLLMANFVIVLLLILFQNSSKITETLFLLFPVSIILANGIELIKKRWMVNVVLYAILIGCLLQSFYL